MPHPYAENGAYLTIFLVSLWAGAAKLAQQTDSRFTLPGALNRTPLGADFPSQSKAERRRRIDACVADPQLGYRGCLQSLLLLERGQRGKGAKALASSHRYLVDTYGQLAGGGR